MISTNELLLQLFVIHCGSPPRSIFETGVLLNRFNCHAKGSACPKSYSEELQQNRKKNDGCAIMSDENVLENMH